jgi:putative FmdB family regulatory protein
MPTYDYECQHCGHGFELFQQMSAAVKRKCPECGKPKLKRLIGTGAGVLFKGSGFYETDYRSESYRKAAKAETETPPRRLTAAARMRRRPTRRALRRTAPTSPASRQRARPLRRPDDVALGRLWRMSARDDDLVPHLV